MDSLRNIKPEATTPLGERIALSADEVAEALGISRAHVWKLTSTGRLPRPVRLGRAVRWPRKDLEQWLAAGAPSRDRWEETRYADGDRSI